MSQIKLKSSLNKGDLKGTAFHTHMSVHATLNFRMIYNSKAHIASAFTIWTLSVNRKTIESLAIILYRQRIVRSVVKIKEEEEHKN